VEHRLVITWQNARWTVLWIASDHAWRIATNGTPVSSTTRLVVQDSSTITISVKS